jgi:uncharacterized repeat protein (TIGR01451 family)
VTGTRSIVRRSRSRRLWASVLVSISTLVLVSSAAAASSQAQATCRGTCVDLSVSETDAVSSVVPGRATGYVVTVRNTGPSTVTSLSLTDLIPPALKGVAYLPLGGSYNPTTHHWSGLSLTAGRSVTLLVGGTVDPAATGTLVNSVAVAPPAGAVDTNPANNSATDTDTLTPHADLSVSETDGTTTAVPGRAATYSLTVRNGGPSTVGSLSLADSLATTLAGAAFAPAAGSYNPSTHLWSGLSLASGQSVTMTLTGTIAPAATGELTNVATVTAPPGVTDPNTGNNSATDIDTLSPQADLSISKSDGTTSAVPGGSTTYTVVVANAGPSSLSGATVRDTMPAAIGSDSWSASNGTSGSGSINATVALAAGSSVTYTVVATVSAAATGTLTNTATVVSPASVPDADQANNSATDTDALTPPADLSVTVTDGSTTVAAGGSTTYTIVVSNAGPASVTGAAISDVTPAGIDLDSWTATASAGSSVDAASGDGSIDSTLSLLAGGSATYTLLAYVDGSATGSINDTGTVTEPPGFTDPNTANNSQTDSDSISVPTANARVKFGDLTLCNLPILPKLDNLTVRQFYNVASRSLGGVITAYDIGALDTLAADLNASFDGAPSAFALAHLGLNTGCAAVPWATGDLTTYAQTDFGLENGPTAMTDYDFANVYALPFDELTVGDSDPGRATLDFEGAGAVFDYLPASGPAGALGTSSFDPSTTSSGVFGGDMVALRLNVDFSDAYTPRTCAAPGTSGCAWGIGDVVTYGQVAWASGPVAALLLQDHYGDVYYPPNPFELRIGAPAATNFNLSFDGADGVQSYLPTSGPPGVLTGTMVDPAHAENGEGVFGGDVAGLQLDIDFSDAGWLPNGTGLDFADLTVCNLTDLPALNGMTVRQVAALANQVLGGLVSTYTPAQIDPLVSQLSVAFTYGEVTDVSAHLFNGACP